MIAVHCELDYTVGDESTVYFAVIPAATGTQHVTNETLVVTPDARATRLAPLDDGTQLVCVVAPPGPLTLCYDANVEVVARVPALPPSTETAFADVPPDLLAYLRPSRYCESDLLERQAMRLFGDLPPGFDRVTGVCNWVYEHLEYVPGSTDGTTTAVDVLVLGAGVCRDFAHLSIGFCRALGIPARYVAGYAVGLQPPDFHGFFEAYLGDDWYLFDATRMAIVDGLVRIAVGRDAADVAYATSVGDVTLDAQLVSATMLDQSLPDPGTTAAIATA